MGQEVVDINENDRTDTNPPSVENPSTMTTISTATSDSKTVTSSSSKREMLSFAIPALGIYLCNPLLSNMDNAFVGQTMGTVGLAALSPATICIDQMLYLFNFLGRATTGIVTRAYYNDDSAPSRSTTNNGDTEEDTSMTTTTNDGGGNTKAARDAASARTFCFSSCWWTAFRCFLFLALDRLLWSNFFSYFAFSCLSLSTLL